VYNRPERDDIIVRCGVRVAMFFVLRAFVVCGRDIDSVERCVLRGCDDVSRVRTDTVEREIDGVFVFIVRVGEEIERSAALAIPMHKQHDKTKYKNPFLFIFNNMISKKANKWK
jgi:hypothetical protein